MKKLSKEDALLIQENISTDLSAFLLEEELCRYDNGFLFTTNPFDYSSIGRLVFNETDYPYVLARTSFADLYISTNNVIYLYQASYNAYTEITSDINYLFNVLLIETSFADKFLFRDIHEEAHQLLGELAYDECYGFVPVIPLGGKEDVNNLQKVKIFEYLSILIQAQKS